MKYFIFSLLLSLSLYAQNQDIRRANVSGSALTNSFNSNQFTLGSDGKVAIKDTALVTNLTVATTLYVPLTISPSGASTTIGTSADFLFDTTNHRLSIGTALAQRATNPGQIILFQTGNGPSASGNGIEFQNNPSGSGYGYKLFTDDSNNVIGFAGRYSSAAWTTHLTLHQQTGLLTLSGSLAVPKTITTVGTTGNQTINKMAGRVNIAAGGSSITVTDSLVTTNSIILCTIATDDSTAILKNCVPGNGSFVIKTTAAVTAETAISFLVIN